jgi:hypothetical protein
LAGYTSQEKQTGMQTAAQQDMSRGQNASQQAVAKTQADAAMYAPRLQQERFNTVLPMFQDLMTQMATGGGMYQPGGQVGQAPPITVGGVYSPDQTQQQVNAARAQNDAALQTYMRAAAGRLAGRGYGADSPVMAALAGQAQGQNVAANADSERQIRMTAAEQNAQHLLGTEQANLQRWNMMEDSDIRRRIPYLQQQTSMLAALAGLV